MNRRGRARAAVLALVLGLVPAAGCEGSKDGSGHEGMQGMESPQAERPSSPAKIQIVEPKAGAVVTGGKVHVKVVIEGARILENPEMVKPKPDEGHVHIALDGKTVVMSFGTEEDVPVEPGRHLLQAQFVAGDHAPFDPAVASTTTFTAE
jgi:hypothetical protein